MQRLTFLGTSAGMPTRHRNVTGLAVSFVNPYGQKTSQNPKKQAKSAPWILIDCGEGTQHQLLKTPYHWQVCKRFVLPIRTATIVMAWQDCCLAWRCRAGVSVCC